MPRKKKVPVQALLACEIREWFPDVGISVAGYAYDMATAASYIGKRSPRGGKYYVSLVLHAPPFRERLPKLG